MAHSNPVMAHSLLASAARLVGRTMFVLLLALLTLAPRSSAADPSIVIEQVPPFGSWGVPLRGHVDGIDPATVKLAFFIRVQGAIWTKPYFTQPAINPLADGSFSVVLTTGGVDDQADVIYVALLDRDQTNVPPMAGQSQFPTDFEAQTLAWLEIPRQPVFREIDFAGRRWSVKQARRSIDPGPSPFSDDQNHVAVDEQGRLHLRIAPQSDRNWAAAEIVSDDSFGYGTYDFGLATPVGDWDTAVLGLFTWDTGSPELHNREIDLEFGRGLINTPAMDTPAPPTAQDVLQPYSVGPHRHRFSLPALQSSRHGFLWAPQALVFATRGPDGGMIDTWTYSGADVPAPGDQTHVRLNLWMLGGRAPDRPVEVIVSDFSYTSLAIAR